MGTGHRVRTRTTAYDETSSPFLPKKWDQTEHSHPSKIKGATVGLAEECMQHVTSRYHHEARELAAGDQTETHAPTPTLIQLEIRETLKMVVLADSSGFFGLFCSRSSLCLLLQWPIVPRRSLSIGSRSTMNLVSARLSSCLWWVWMPNAPPHRQTDSHPRPRTKICSLCLQRGGRGPPGTLWPSGSRTVSTSTRTLHAVIVFIPDSDHRSRQLDDRVFHGNPWSFSLAGVGLCVDRILSGGTVHRSQRATRCDTACDIPCCRPYVLRYLGKSMVCVQSSGYGMVGLSFGRVTYD